MKIFKIVTTIIIGFIFLSCIQGRRPVDFSTIFAASTGESSAKTSKRRSSSKRVRSSCVDDEDCEDICEDIYDDDDDDGDGVIERCLKLSKKTIGHFDTIIDYLSDPTLRNVRTVKEEYSDEFEDLINVSLSPWIDVADSVSPTEAEALLTFIASSDVIASALKKGSRNYEGYDKYEGIKELLTEARGSVNAEISRAGGGGDTSTYTIVTPSKCNTFYYALCELGISGSDTFSEIAVTEENTHATSIRDSILLAACDTDISRWVVLTNNSDSCYRD